MKIATSMDHFIGEKFFDKAEFNQLKSYSITSLHNLKSVIFTSTSRATGRVFNKVTIVRTHTNSSRSDYLVE